jgi:hypothetical protein
MILAVALSGCKITGNSASASQASLRLVHFDAGVGAINLTSTAAGNTPTPSCPCDIQGVSFGGVSNYVNYDSGNSTIYTVALGDGSATLATDTFTLSANTDYTLILYGSIGNPGSMLLADTTINTPASGTFEIRPVHVASGSGSLDFYVIPVPAGTNPSTINITNAAPSFSSFSLTGVPLFVQYNAGTYVMFVTPANSKTILYESAPVTFNNGDIPTAAIYTTGSGTLVNVDLLYQNNSAGGSTTANTVTPVPNLFSQFKVVNASPNIGSINVLNTPAGGTTIGAFSNVPFTGTSSYLLTPAGTNNLEVRATSNPNSDATAASENFAGSTDSSVILVGNAPNVSLIALTDDNLPPSLGDAKLRFVNVSPNAGPIDVQVNFAAVPAASALATNTASTYVNFVQNPLPGYTITANITGTATTALTLNGVEVVAGGTYTIYIMGNAGALQGIITRDN